MFRHLATATPRDLMKWGIYVLIALAPGSFLILSALWVIRRLPLVFKAG